MWNSSNMNIKILLLISGSDIITKIISLFLFIKRLSAISKEVNKKSSLLPFYSDTLKKNQESNNWSKTSMFKFTINIILSLSSFFIAIVKLIFEYIFKDKDSSDSSYSSTDNDQYSKDLIEIIIFTVYFLFEGIMWLISSILYCEEINNYRNQSWNGLRFFWFTNGIFICIKIATLILVILNEDIEIQLILEGILFVIQFFFSIILFFYAIFRPYDFRYSNIEQIFNEHCVNSENNSELNSISNDDSILEYNDILDNDDAFKDESFYNILIKNNLNNNNPTKVSFYLKIKTNDFTALTFIIKSMKNKYIKKKSPSELSIFIKKIIKVYKNKKYENNIINLSQQSYNISLTINPRNNSFTGKKDSVNILTHLFNEIIKNSNNFLLDLLLFLDLSDIDLVELLKNNNIKSSLDEVDVINDKDEYDSSIEKSISTSKMKINNSLNLTLNDNKSILLINNVHQMSRDMIRLYIFLNNILTKDKFISIKIIKYDEEKKEIECLLKINNPSKQVTININCESFIDIIYDDELKSYYIDNFNSMTENNDYSILENLLNDYLSNVIYYDDNLFKIFQLNKIVNLDIEKFNENVLINFFEYDNIECDNNIGNILFDINLSPPNEEGNNNNKKIFTIKYTVKGIDQKNIINKMNKDVNIDLNLIKLYIIIDNILPIINSYIQRNFNELYSALSELKTHIENYIQLFLDIDTENIKKINYICLEEINKLKYAKMLFGETKINEHTSLMEKKLLEKSKKNDIYVKNNIMKITEKIKVIHKALNNILNNKNLKYVLFFSFIRKILGIFELF
jgi:hypothetical protein